MTTRTRKAQPTTNVPVKLARRCGLDGFSTTAGGGYFATTLGTLLGHFAPGSTLECLWLEGQAGLGCAEATWLAHHYPQLSTLEV